MENKAKRCSVPFVVLIFLLSSWVAACGRPALGLPSPTPPEQLPPAVDSQPSEELPPVDDVADGDKWNTVETFAGEGNETTPPFHISGTKWRITWAVEAEYPDYAAFDLFIYPEGTHSMFTDRISYSGGSTGDTVYIYEGGQDYYIKVIAANLRGWNIRVDDYATKIPLSPVQITHIYHKGTVETTESEEGGCFEINELDEYVEIRNLSYCSQDISGWVLKNITKGYPLFTFPSYTMAPGEIIAVYTDELHWLPQQLQSRLAGYVQARYDVSCERNYPCMFVPSEPGGFTFSYCSGDIWDNEEPDTAVLYNAEGQEVSRKSYTVPTVEERCPVQITNIHYKGTLCLLQPDDGGGSERVEIDEYVEIRHLGGYPQETDSCFQDLNPDQRVQDMSGWVLKNITKGYPLFTFPLGFRLFPGEIIRIYTHPVHPEFVYADEFHIRSSGLSFNYAPGDLWDNEEADTAVLYNTQGEEVCRNSYRVPTHRWAPANVYQ